MSFRVVMWSPEEDARLRELYPVIGNKCTDQFPGRSKNAIEQRAGLLKIRRVWPKKPEPKYKHWSEAEDELLRDLWPSQGLKTSIPGRSQGAIEQRAWLLCIKLKRKRGPKVIESAPIGTFPEGRVASVFHLAEAL